LEKVTAAVIQIETDRLILRGWRETDREPFARMNSDRRVMEFFPALLSDEESNGLVDHIEAHFTPHGFGLSAAELHETGEFIGYIGLAVPRFNAAFTPCIEIGWRLAAEHWGNGLATEGARAVLRHAFDVLNLDEIVSFTVPANLRSRRVMEKLGMTRDPAEDFDHPSLPAGHPLRRHVLYRLPRVPRTNLSFDPLP
jgi:ribosomal-protein-alanine N-acetyltransferase